ncbi:MAG: 16S rRNA (uracil(1498)-N(3))-methyltransferase [Dermatophilaceae bacterium]
MTAPLFHLPAGGLTDRACGDLVVLDGPEGHHASTVTRLQVGEVVLCADGSGLLAEAVVDSVGRGELTVRVVTIREAIPPAPRLVLAQALVKDGRDERAVEAATELGADEIVPWQAQRCVVRWRGPRGEKARAKWAAVADAAAKQARRATVPTVPRAVDSASLARRVQDCVVAGGLAVVLHEEADVPLAGLPLERAWRLPEILLIIGPEGGLAPEELDVLVAAGAAPVRLGSEILRAGTAGAAALAVCLAATRWRGEPPPVDCLAT